MCRVFIAKANALSHYKVHITFSKVNLGGGGVAFLARTFAYFRRENYPLSSPADAGWHKLFRRAQFPGRLNSPLWRRRIKNSNAASSGQAVLYGCVLGAARTHALPQRLTLHVSHKLCAFDRWCFEACWTRAIWRRRSSSP